MTEGGEGTGTESYPLGVIKAAENGDIVGGPARAQQLAQSAAGSAMSFGEGPSRRDHKRPVVGQVSCRASRGERCCEVPRDGAEDGGDCRCGSPVPRGSRRTTIMSSRVALPARCADLGSCRAARRRVPGRPGWRRALTLHVLALVRCRQRWVAHTRSPHRGVRWLGARSLLGDGDASREGGCCVHDSSRRRCSAA